MGRHAAEEGRAPRNKHGSLEEDSAQAKAFRIKTNNGLGMDIMKRLKLKAWPNPDWEQVKELCGSMSDERASELTSRMQVMMIEYVDEKLSALIRGSIEQLC